MRELIQQLMENSIDFHLHVAPDASKERSVDAYEAAQQAKNANMKAIVFKAIDIPTMPMALLTKKKIEGIEIFGSVTLNQSVGGLNPHAVEASAKIGAKIVWMPTVSSAGSRKQKGLSDGISIIDNNGNVLPVVREIITLAKEFNLILCTGHLNQKEIIALFDESKNLGLSKFVITHPLKVAGTSIDLRVQKELAEKGAYIDHCYSAALTLTDRLDPCQIYDAVKFVGAERCILSTDCGNFIKPVPVEGMRTALATMFQYGLSENELKMLVKENPARLLDL